MKSAHLFILLLLFVLPCTVQGALSNKNCNAYTFADVPECMAECTRNCTLQAEIMGTPGTYPANGSKACQCEKEICTPKHEMFGCSTDALKVWKAYVSDGCKLIPVAGRCSECLRLGCSFCDRRESTAARRESVAAKERISFCYNSDIKPVDPFYGKCDSTKNEDFLKLYSNTENEETICADTTVYLPAVAVILYLLIVVICPLGIFGFIWYSICFGIPRKIREGCCNASSASVFAAPPQNDFSHGNWQGRTVARPGPAGRMYVLPSDTVPAEVSLSTRTIPNSAVQTGVVLQPSGGYGAPSIVRSDLQASTGGSQMEIPIAYAQEL